MDTMVTESQTRPYKRGITGSTLKMIAMLTMLVDHFGATVFTKIFVNNPVNFGESGEPIMNGMFVAYIVLRGIGRIAFPIFIFLLVEGFFYTRNRFRYIGRMLLFAVVSEIPFDMAFNIESELIRKGQVLEFTYQNVFFTLAFGLIVLTVLEGIRAWKGETILKVVFSLCMIALGAVLAYVVKSDYGVLGVLAIVSAYFVRNQSKSLQIVFPCVVLMIDSFLEAFALVGVFPVRAYNGERGWNLKWVFYLFYPVHLLIFSGICMLM